MGDPKKIRKKYKKPMHPWQKARIDLEKELSKKYLPKINVLIFLFFGISIIGFLFAGVMSFSNNVKKEAKIFIGIFITHYFSLSLH